MFAEVDAKFKWAAMDNNGSICVYTHKPIIRKQDLFWGCTSDANSWFEGVASPPRQPQDLDYWRESLIEREEQVRECPNLACTRVFGHDGPCAIPEAPHVAGTKIADMTANVNVTVDVKTKGERKAKRHADKQLAKAYLAMLNRVNTLHAAEAITYAQYSAIVQGIAS